MEQPVSSKSAIIKNIYLYLVSFVALLMVVFSFADIINIFLRTYVLKMADQAYSGYYPEPACLVAPDGSTSTKGTGCVAPEEREKIDKRNNQAQKQRDLVRDISFIVVGIPLFLYHWRIIRKKENI